jgi:hypothetical protein
MQIDPVGVWISGPLAAFSDGYASELTRIGYAPASVRQQMKVLADLSGWLLKRGMVAAHLRSNDLDRFPCSSCRWPHQVCFLQSNAPHP